ncbi:hypothetical protein GCM10025868_23340 [Angustibacter aerolatus]|uniref:Uncharacterized protein n=1 Tax=Angustibacter aerolatus TaxID=1162965 RepID=A0ABQ6JI90_9ACTN|nr:hypothetical protein GCM10025868_23340 [Angustibacter aerolatus]
MSGRTLDPQRVVVGIGLGMALGYTVGAVLSAVLLHRRLRSLDGARVLRTYVRLAVAAAPAAALAWGSRGWCTRPSTGSRRPRCRWPSAAPSCWWCTSGSAGSCTSARLDEVAGPVLRRLPGRR